MRTMLIGLLMVGTAYGGATLEPVAEGSGEISIKAGKYDLQLYTFKPKNYDPKKSELLLVFHGKSRNANSYRDYAETIAKKSGAIVVAPLFDKDHFAGNAYGHGNMMAKGVLLPREQWAFSLVPEIIAAIRELEQRPDMPVTLFGHSQGGQFVGRMAAFNEVGAVNVVAANPGSQLFPTKELLYPYGFGGLPDALGSREQIKKYLGTPITFYAGTSDNDPMHPDLDNKPEAMKQGKHRYERARNCFDLGQKLAKQEGCEFRWRFIEASDVGHSAAKMLNHANCFEALFGKKQ